MNSYFVYSDHRVPEGSHIIDLKYCEGCGRPFSRRAHSAICYCPGCRSRSLMPDLEGQLSYLAQMPGTETQMAHSLHLPHYDNSLAMGRETSSHAVKSLPQPAMKRTRRPPDEVSALLLSMAEASKKSGITTEQMCELMPAQVITPMQAYRFVKDQQTQKRVKITRLGDAPRRINNGRVPGVYRVELVH